MWLKWMSQIGNDDTDNYDDTNSNWRIPHVTHRIKINERIASKQKIHSVFKIIFRMILLRKQWSYVRYCCPMRRHFFGCMISIRNAIRNRQ